MALPYQVVEPQTPQYWQLISTAIKTGDKETLSALRGNTNKSIHVVNNWFCYWLIASSNQIAKIESDEVIIYTPEARSDMIRALCNSDEYKQS